MSISFRSLRTLAIPALILLGIGACQLNTLSRPEQMIKERRYVAAIEDLDNIIQKDNNGANVTRAQLLRSEAYYQLGLMAKERQNWPLTIRLLKLANSEDADNALAETYRYLGGLAEAAGDYETFAMYLNLIIREIPQSSLIPEVLLKRITLSMNIYLDKEAAWMDYKRLYDNYPDNSFEIQARTTIKPLLPLRVQYAETLLSQAFYVDALNILFELYRYPVLDKADLQKRISDVYQAQAESMLRQEDYLEADKLLRIALQYYPAKKAEIDAKLNSITSLFIKKGDAYLAARDFDNALLNYNKTFEIIPDYEPGLKALDRLRQVQFNIRQAEELYHNAQKAEAERKFAEALRLYQQAQSLEPRTEYGQKIALMQNTIEAERDPVGFTQRIINGYGGGILNTRIKAQLATLGKRYKKNEIRDNGWKILLSSGQYKYEARYDILTPQETFFYVWQVNLRERTIVPLNKISEALMK